MSARRTQLRFTVTLIGEDAIMFSDLMKLMSHTPAQVISYLMQTEKVYHRLCEENARNETRTPAPRSLDYETRSIKIEPPSIDDDTSAMVPMEYLQSPLPSTPLNSTIRIDQVREYVDREEPPTSSRIRAAKPTLFSGRTESFQREDTVDGNRRVSGNKRTRGGRNGAIDRTPAITSIALLLNDDPNGVYAEQAPIQSNPMEDEEARGETNSTAETWRDVWNAMNPIPNTQSTQTPTEWRLPEIPKRSREDDEVSVDSDGTWDDEPPEPNPTVSAPTIQDSQIPTEESASREEESTKPKEPEPLRLLKPNYFQKFSHDARLNVPRGSRRSVAAMANTRRHIVERCQLKMLLARCVCTTPNCSRRLDKKSIKITNFGFTIVIKATCDKGHKFEWASSAKVPHQTASKRGAIYTLNVATHSAITISGASWSRMELFAKALRLNWETRNSHAKHTRAMNPVVRECFDHTQKEMFDKLQVEQSNGNRLVLAGDGQFDRAGPCATTCSYALMALAMDEPNGGVTRKCGYVLNQAVVDKRLAECKTISLERLGLHWAMQPIRDAGLQVTELVTDDHVPIVRDFEKITAASEERRRNEEDGETESAALDRFVDSLSTALTSYNPEFNEDVHNLLTFYEAIVQTNDIWHCAKNILKAISTIAGTAPKKEQETYRKYAKMLKNYLWECAEKAKGNEDVFKEMWTAVASHVEGEHENCAKYDMHTKTRLMAILDPTCAAFDRFVRHIRKVADGAEQLCRFRHTGPLDSYNNICAIYCPKRIYIPHDSMVMRRHLAALDHNHHVNRAFKTLKDGHVQLTHVKKKSTKAFRLEFKKEAKTYDYIPHLMAAILWNRCTMDWERSRAAKSSTNPTTSICSTASPQEDQQGTLAATCSAWLTKNPHQADMPKGRAASNVIRGGKRRSGRNSGKQQQPSKKARMDKAEEEDEDEEEDALINHDARAKVVVEAIVNSENPRQAEGYHKEKEAEREQQQRRAAIAQPGGAAERQAIGQNRNSSVFSRLVSMAPKLQK